MFMYGDAISIVVPGELGWAVARLRRLEENRAAPRALLTAVRAVDLDAEVARQHGRLRAHLRPIRVAAPSVSASVGLDGRPASL